MCVGFAAKADEGENVQNKEPECSLAPESCQTGRRARRLRRAQEKGGAAKS
jgi:hypothetical protein